MLTHRRRSERGQVLILFVALFSVFLIVGAFAIDQGFWYGQRRVVQADADLAARAGAIAYIGDIDDDAGARNRVNEALSDNGANPGDLVGDVTIDCPAASGARGVRVQLQTNVRGFFSSLPMIGGSAGGVEVGAGATACMGATGGMVVPSPSSNPDAIEAIPVAMRHDEQDDDDRACFDDDDILELGKECVIWDALFSTTDRRVIFRDPDDRECYRGGNPSPAALRNGIEDGIAFTCLATQNCAVRTTMCIHSGLAAEGEQDEVFDGFRARLERSAGCNQNFQSAFGNGDGARDDAPVLEPFPLRGAEIEAADNHVYVRKDCLGNPRIVVMPIVDHGDDLSAHELYGFAVVYLTGCYVGVDFSFFTDIDPIEEPNEYAESDECASGGRCDARLPGFLPFDEWAPRLCEVRGVPVHIQITDGAIGNIRAASPNAPLTIQTVE